MRSNIRDSEHDPLLAAQDRQVLHASLSENGSGVKKSPYNESDGYDPSPSPVEGEVIEYNTLLDDEVLPETATTGRNLNWSSAYIIIASRMLGTGVFATPGSIVKSVGSPGLSIILWVAGGILAACGLAVSLELGCMLPRSGGDKVYLEYICRRPRFLASILIAAQTIFLSFTAGNSTIFGEYVLYAFGIEPTAFQQRTLALGLLFTICFAHSVFPKTGILIQNTLGWIKIFLMILMVLTGLIVLFWHQPAQYPTFASLFEESIYHPSALATASFKISYAFAGYNNLNNILNEVHNPITILKSAAPTALLTISLSFLLLNIAYFLVIPLHSIKSSGDMIAALYLTRIFGPHVGHTLLPLMIAISAAGNVMVVTFTLSRVNQEIARTGLLPLPKRVSSFLSSSKPFSAPMGGFLLHFIPTALVITLPPPGEVYTFILDVESYPVQIVALATSIGLLWLRSKRPELKRPFRAWKAAVWIRILFCLVLVVAPFFPPENGVGDVTFTWYGTYAVVGIGILLVATGYWFLAIFLLPRLGEYKLEESLEALDDGTTVTRLSKVRND
jgi:amino acid transporter